MEKITKKSFLEFWQPLIFGGVLDSRTKINDYVMSFKDAIEYIKNKIDTMENERLEMQSTSIIEKHSTWYKRTCWTTGKISYSWGFWNVYKYNDCFIVTDNEDWNYTILIYIIA